MVDLEDEPVLRRIFCQEFHHGVVGSDFADGQSLAGDAIGKRERFLRGMRILRRHPYMQSRYLNIVYKLSDSEQASVTGTKDQRVHRDQRWQIFTFTVQEFDTLGHAPRRKVGASEFADLHLPG